MKKIHLRLGLRSPLTDKDFTVCGVWLSRDYVTTDKRQVTCKNCRRARITQPTRRVGR